MQKAWYEKSKILDIFSLKNIDENIRWEDLNIRQWCDLITVFNKNLT